MINQQEYSFVSLHHFRNSEHINIFWDGIDRNLWNEIERKFFEVDKTANNDKHIPLISFYYAISWVPNIKQLMLNCLPMELRDSFSNQLSLRPVRALLNPMIFNNELFWQKVHHVNDQQLSFMYPVQFSHHGKELLCFYPDLKQLIEHHICHIPNLHSILLECVHDENGKALVNELFSQIKFRAILDPQKFNNETFWNHCHTLNCDELDFNQSSLYPYQNSMILCEHPELRQVVEKNWQHQPYLHFYLNDCALTTDAVNEVEQIFSSLQKNPVFQSIMPVYSESMLGQIGFNDSSFLYFKLLAGVLTAAAGASSLVLAITTFNLFILSVSGIIAASVGISLLVASGMFFKSAHNDYKEPSQFQI